MTTKPVFGTYFVVAARLEKQRRDQENGKIQTIWQRRDDRPVAGRYIGYRTLSEGYTRWVNGTSIMSYEPEDDYRAFTATQRFTVYLIVPSERANPVYVLPEDVQPEGITLDDCYRATLARLAPLHTLMLVKQHGYIHRCPIDTELAALDYDYHPMSRLWGVNFAVKRPDWYNGSKIDTVWLDLGGLRHAREHGGIVLPEEMIASE